MFAPLAKAWVGGIAAPTAAGLVALLSTVTGFENLGDTTVLEAMTKTVEWGATGLLTLAAIYIAPKNKEKGASG